MKLRYKGQIIEYKEDDIYLDLANRYKGDYDGTIILAKIGQRLIELGKKVSYESGLCNDEEIMDLSFITTKDRDGEKTYERGAIMMFICASYEIFFDMIEMIRVECAIGDSIFIKLKLKDRELNEDDVLKIKNKMEEYVSSNTIFEKMKLRSSDVSAMFKNKGMKDKERLFHYRLSSTTNVYKFRSYYDYFYGYMPYSAGYINIFDLKKIDEGILLVLPNILNPDKQGSYEVPKKLFRTMVNTSIWGENIGITNVSELNDDITRGEGRNIILSSEAYFEHQIGNIASSIKKDNKKIVFIAGPSSSGKTSFSHRLSIQLSNLGIKAHPIAMDNYYLDRDLVPVDENGEKDFECLEAFNIELFNEKMISLMKGEKTELPYFNFKSGKCEYNGDYLKLGDSEVLVCEGIHGLNDKFSYAINESDKYKIYISAITALNIDDHNRIPTTDHREIRRIVRDARTRGFSPDSTIARWDSVRRGEEKYIFPYQENADYIFNSASVYELAVLKTYAMPLLFTISKDKDEYPEAKRLLKFLEYFLPLPSEDVPRNSLVREFIGGSIFPVG